MNQQFYLDLAARGLRMPIGADLVLRAPPYAAEAARIQRDGKRLAEVLLRTAEQYHTPLVFPLMDLMLEKAALLELMGVDGAAGAGGATGGGGTAGAGVDSYHFATGPTDAQVDRFESNLKKEVPPRLRANVEALRIVAREAAARGIVPVGMSIGPVSLMTKLVTDPITPIYMAGEGTTAAADPEVHAVERTLEVATQMVLRSVEVQIEAGAKAIFIAEPAANQAFFSPHQLAGELPVWDRYVMASNRRVAGLLEKHGVDLFFHCCGELDDAMVTKFGTLRPALLSLGSSRRLWEDAPRVPASTVLYGNLPTKKFYSDQVLAPERVAALTRELVRLMKQTHHPFILGSECDVLSVPGCHATIARKIDLMMTAV